jgi:hypothetical protein
MTFDDFFQKQTYNYVVDNRKISSRSYQPSLSYRNLSSWVIQILSYKCAVRTIQTRNSCHTISTNTNLLCE